MTSIYLDFKQSVPRRVQLVRYVILAIGSLALFTSLAYQSKLASQLTAASWKNQARVEIKPPSASSPVEQNPQSLQEFKRASQVMMKLNQPWDSFFEAIEKSVGKNVGILSITPDSQKSSVKIVALTKNIESAMDFIDQLGSKGVFNNAYLTNQERVEDYDRLPLSVTITADWTDTK